MDKLKNLEKYRETMKAAKASLNKDYQDYVKQYYAESKRLRKGGVKLAKGHKQGLFKAGQSFQGWERAEVYNEADYTRYRHIFGGTNADLIKDQYNLIDSTLALRLQAILVAEGLGYYSLERIQARQLPQAVWDKMTIIADMAGVSINEYFFGS